jgi:drug/metabolite transporter (DMT)-like permease
MSGETARLRVKTWLCALLVIASHVAGNFFMKRGVPSELAAPLDYIAALFRPWLALGVLLLIVWTLLRMALLSWADLSYVLPVTAVEYVLVALAGRVYLHEAITARRWAGIALIVAGAALVGAATAPQTYRKAREETAPQAEPVR